MNQDTEKTTTRRRLVAKPATTPRAILAARQRRDDLAAVLRLRGAVINRELLAKGLQSGDGEVVSASRQALAKLNHSPYARAAAKYLLTHEKFAYQEARKAEARHVDLDDLVQAARIGLLKGLDRFDASLVESGLVTSFLSYARWWVKCEIGKALDDEALVKIPSTARKAATDLRHQLATITTASESLTDQEVADALCMKLTTVQQHRNLHLGHEHYEVESVGDVNKDHSTSSGPHGVVMESLSELTTEHALDSQQKARGAALDHAVGLLPPVQRKLVCEQFGLQIDDIAAASSRPRSDVGVRTLLKAALSRLRGLLDDDGILFAT